MSAKGSNLKTRNINESIKQSLNPGEDDCLLIYGYRKNNPKLFTTYIFYFLTLGLLRLIFHWFPTWKLYTTHSKCPLKNADKVLIEDQFQGAFKSYFVEEVKNLRASLDGSQNFKLKVYLEGTPKEMHEIRAIWCKRLCYIWDDERSKFVALTGLDQGRRCNDYHNVEGYSSQEQALGLITYGKNEIDVPIKTILTLLVLEALTPFYIFQVFSLIVWFAEAYYYYTIAIVVMSVFGITTSIIQTRRNQRSLQDSVHSAETVRVRRSNGEFEEIFSYNLIPGDVIQIPKHGAVMQCDAVLLNGNCIVNESMLTGESVPVTKTPIPKTNSFYDVKEDAFHTLFCGTKVIQVRSSGKEEVLAVVIRTGFLTSKGELVRSILYPPPTDFKFDQDSYKFIGILTVIALLGCVYTIVAKSGRSFSAFDIIIKALDLITIVIPPALPAAMTVGKLYALSRLKKHEIFCMNSRVINVSGSINCVCFDKTGTLTEDGLDMWGVISIEENKIKEHIKEASMLPESSAFLRGMATCHSLTVIDEAFLGDPLDVKVFESTKWVLEETDDSDHAISRKVKSGFNDEISVLRQYQFSSTLQRMSVITRNNNFNNLEIFCKGSPEMIISLSRPTSVPNGINEKLKDFTAKGYRVIALGMKTMESLNLEEVQKLERASVESDLKLVGLIILENRIKPQTPGVIKVLKEANVKIVMITGDNIQTALSVGKECGIVSNELVVEINVTSYHTKHPELSFNVNEPSISDAFSRNENSMENGQSSLSYVYALNGTVWSAIREHFPEKLTEIVDKGAIFARMSGQQKQQLIQELKSLGYYAAMCGDGANDCGALKAAHVGISLSDEESSVASPFTSKNPDISCVPKIVREGRAALTTSLGVFKFMICYSLTQFTSVIILYGIDSNLTSLQFLFIDICLIIHFTSFFGKTEAYKGRLNKRRPLESLLSFVSMSSITFQLFFVILFQIIAYKVVQMYEWFEPFEFSQDEELYSCYENYAVFSVSMFQYIIMAVAFSKGKPYRMPIYTNKILMTSLFVMTMICCYITFYPANWIIDALELEMPPNFDMAYATLAIIAVNFVCSLFAEEFVIGTILEKKVHPKLFEKIKPVCNNNVEFYPKKGEDVVHINRETEVKEPENKKLQGGFVNHAFEDSDFNSQITKL